MVAALVFATIRTPSHFPADRFVESNPRVDVWALLRDGVLVEGLRSR
jgi:hypothetical protein